MQQTSTVNLPAFFSIFQTQEHVLRVHKSKITGENTFNGDSFGSEGNQESSNNAKYLFWVVLSDLRPVVLPLDSDIRIFTFFEHCLVFAIFKSLPVGFGS